MTAALDAHYRCTGLDTSDPNTFDTEEALLVGARVRQELAIGGGTP